LYSSILSRRKEDARTTRYNLGLDDIPWVRNESFWLKAERWVERRGNGIGRNRKRGPGALRVKEA